MDNSETSAVPRSRVPVPLVARNRRSTPAAPTAIGKENVDPKNLRGQRSTLILQDKAENRLGEVKLKRMGVIYEGPTSGKMEEEQEAITKVDFGTDIRPERPEEPVLAKTEKKDSMSQGQ